MYLLLLVLWSRQSWPLAILVLLGAGGAWMIARSFGNPVKYKKSVLIPTGIVMCVPIMFVGLMYLMFSGFDQSTTSFYRSASGDRIALLYHSEGRDSSASTVLVKRGCCRVATVYDYHGYGSDYVHMLKAKPVEWVDDSHLVIRYARDVSSLPKSQTCPLNDVDAKVSCQPLDEPTFPISGSSNFKQP